LKQLRALLHTVSPRLGDCELTFLEREKIDIALAQAQHQEYSDCLQKLGVTVTLLSGNAAFPDACFVEDTAIIVDDLAIITSMGIASRRGESVLIAHELSKYLELAKIDLPATIEGGDVLKIGKTFFVGESGRTNRLGIDALKELVQPLGYRVVSVTTHGSLHLKSACTALDDETVLLNPEWIEALAFQGLQILHTLPEEPGAANLLRVGDQLCIQTCFPRTIEKLIDWGAHLQLINTSELGKAEGALTCLSLLFESP
jgi:dimethylargininase